LYKYTDIGAIGFDLWQVKSGTIFDNVLLTDDEKHAEAYGEETWGAMKDGEKKMKEAHDEEEKKKREEEDKKRKDEEEKNKDEKPEEDDDDEDDDDDEEEEKKPDKDEL